MNNKKALIFGITGQDGSFLAELLLSKGYTVHGLKRRTSILHTDRIDNIYYNNKYKKKFYLHYTDLFDGLNILELIKKIKPDEIYNLAAQSHVAVSFELPSYSTDIDAVGTLRILESIKILNLRKTKFYQASSSEMYGDVKGGIQDENTKFNPASPYACAKVYSYYLTKYYRNAFNIYAANGILFNHESERRGETFVTKKIANSVARIYLGLEKKLIIGNLNSKRDWGYAPEYVEGIWKILQQKKADDFVLATGKSYTVRKFAELSFKAIGIKIIWKGRGLGESGYDSKNGKKLIEVSKKYFRPLEVNYLQGNSAKARKVFGWKPKTTLFELATIMVKHEIKKITNEKN